MKKHIVLTVFAVLCLALPTFAAEHAAKPAAKPAAAPATAPVTAEVAAALDTFTQGCQQELTTYCKDVTPGEGRILACLYAFQDKVTPRCERALYDSLGQLDRTLSNLQFAVTECNDDLKTVCADVKPGEGRLLDCLNKNEAKVSKRCTTALKDVGYKK